MAPPQPAPAREPAVVAAGAVVVRKVSGGREVLLVHRPKYDDWSFPKGKQDPGEQVSAAAVREVLEETGVEVRLGRPLRPQEYAVSGGRDKLVHYWIGHVVGDEDTSSYPPNQEVDHVGWFPLEEAKARLTYLDDIDLLEQYHRARKPTVPLVIVRHAKAAKRASWAGPDPERPLTRAGDAQAAALSAVLHAYGVSRALTSSSTRCVQTLRPYAEEQVVTLEQVAELSEEGYDERGARDLLSGLMGSPEPAVLCSHRPILPELLGLLGLDEEPLAPAELLVCHHRNGDVLAVERHLAR